MARHKHKLQTCPNCDHGLEPHYEFCPTCGQENHDIRVPIGHIGYEFVEGITHFDTKLWHTLNYYFTRPGQMTKEYLDGKRARFVPPPRLYIFVSVIFFIILSGLSHQVTDGIKSKVKNSSDNLIFIQDSVQYRLYIDDAELFLCLNAKQGDSLLIANKNPLSRDFTLLRGIIRDSIINKELRSNNMNLSIAQIAKELGKDFNEPHDEVKDSSSVKKSLSDDENKEIKARKDSLKSMAYILEIDSMYKGLNCPVSDQDRSVFDIFEASYSKKDINLAQTMTDDQLDSLILERDTSASTWIQRPFLRNLNDYYEGNFDTLFNKAIKAFSTGMFLFMPIIAFITFVFFRKVRKFYVEHLVFSIHIHTFIFLVLCIYLMIRRYLGDDSVSDFIDNTCIYSLLIGLPLYIIKSIKVVFENPWGRSIFKFLIISSIYTVLLLFFVLGAFLMGVIM